MRLLHRRELAAHGHRAQVSRSLGVSDEELLVLLHLREYGGTRQAALAELLCLSRSGLGAMIQRLERAGYVRREADADDRRVRLVTLAHQARERIEQAYAQLSGEIERLLARRPADERAALERFLSELVEVSEGQARLAQRATPAPAPAARAVWRLWR